ncbi:MAG TPA: hypothetical protein VJA47_00500 [archaeon]|nr:hypothetical protein [archaeon]
MTDLKATIKDYLRVNGETRGGQLLQEFAKPPYKASDVMLALFGLNSGREVLLREERDAIFYKVA